MRLPAVRGGRRAGVTLFETLIAASILASALIPILLLAKSGVSTLRQTSAADSADTRARRTLGRASRELLTCTVASLSAVSSSPNWVSSITLDKLLTLNPATGVATTQRLDLRFERDPGDPNDGVDNDRDGLIDEGMVTMTRAHGTVGAERTILVQGVAEYLERETPNGADDNGNGLVDENGFCIERVGGRLTLRLTLVTRTASGEFVRRTAIESLTVRN